jgi:hypothetical protein
MPDPQWEAASYGNGRPAPAIALNTANQPLAVVVDLDQRAMAVGAVLPPIAAFTVC